jgi:imidazolonepropionase-like amidohydrolase/ABC-type multidrug transport system permease subunit
MKGYLALTVINLKLALRERTVLFFSYVFPLLFFFGFGQFTDARNTGAILRIVPMVLMLGILGNGLFGAGIRAVAERETNILRRYKVTPITPAPILVASLVTGWLLYLPALIVIIGLAHFYYRMPFPEQPVSLFLLISIGCVAFRAIGLIVAAVANSVAESNILVQLLYMPMLFISGVTFPISAMPGYMQIIAQFLPASYLNTGIQRVLVRGETLQAIPEQLVALVLSTIVGTWLAMKLFRWEKEEKLPRSAKLWVVAVFLPFIGLGLYQTYSRENIMQAKTLEREFRRNRPLLVRNGHIITGDGRYIRAGAVLIRNGRIEEVFEDVVPSPESVQADSVEAAGKTLMPGLVDLSVRLITSGGVPDTGESADFAAVAKRALASSLYCGVIAVRDSGSPLQLIAPLAGQVRRGEFLGAEILEGDTEMPALASLVLREGGGALLTRSLTEQVIPAEELRATRAIAENFRPPDEPEPPLLDLWKAGRTIAVATRSGEPLLFHGPTIHRELQLWVEAGIPAAAAIEAATRSGASLLGAGDRIGLIRAGYEASFLVLDGNPLEDIAATERISTIFFKGERVDRLELFQQE